MKIFLWLLLGALLVLWVAFTWPGREPLSVSGSADSPAAFVVAHATLAAPIHSAARIIYHDIPMPADTPAAHASFLLADKQGLRAFWFAGSRESGADVQIWQSRFDGAAWSAPTVAVNRHSAFQHLGWHSWIRRIGNPVAWMDGQGRVHLYVVATFIGGWGGSRILHLIEAAPHDAKQQGKVQPAFVPQGFLALSWLCNVSFLVRGSPVPLQDGGAMLPVYFEMGLKFPVALRLGADGRLASGEGAQVRMSPDWKTLQPSVVARSSTEAMAYMRDDTAHQQMRVAQTKDGGQSWHEVALPSPIVNPGASIAALRLPDDSVGLIRNPDRTGRARLVLERSVNGVDAWQTLAVLEDERAMANPPPFNEYSYPASVLLGDELHISYTYQKKSIRHAVIKLRP